MKEILANIAKLIDLKSILTAAMTFGMLMMVAKEWQPTETVMALFSSTYGMMIAFFFSKKSAASDETAKVSETVEADPVYTGTLEDAAGEINE